MKPQPLTFPTVELPAKVLNWQSIPQECQQMILESNTCTIFRLCSAHNGINLDNHLTILCDGDYSNIVVLEVGNYRMNYVIKQEVSQCIQ